MIRNGVYSAGSLQNLRAAFCSDPRNGSSQISAFSRQEGLQTARPMP